MPEPLIFVNPAHTAHDTGPGMPDRAGRIDVCVEALKKSSTTFRFVAAEPATRTALERVHEPRYLDWLDTLCREGGGMIDADTLARPGSWEAALQAAGACCEAVEAAFAGDPRSFCLVRPPGHHATADQAMGFCLVNNAAVGAAHAIGAGLAKRVALIDFDVHHGNGTQDIFWERADVLYVSIHQWPWYPWNSGALEERGAGAGLGTNINVPLPEGADDEVHLAALEQVVGPAVRDFEPDLLMISAGFDAHKDDPLSLQEVTSEGFGQMTSALVRLAGETTGGRIVMTLEGGYNLKALPESVLASAEVLAANRSSRIF